MVDALTSLDVVEGLEDFLNRSPEMKTVTDAKVPRTGRRTGTVNKPIGDVSESGQPMTKSTKRTTRRAISDEIMQETKTPDIRRSRKTVEFAETESEGIEDVEKKSVTDTPALATYSQRSQVACKSSVKEVSTVQRVYSTRRSARLTENKDGEEKEKKIDLGDGLDKKNLSVEKSLMDNDYPKEIAGGTEISSVPPFVYLLSVVLFVSSGEAENKPVTKTPSVKGLNCVSDDKENINRNGMKFEPKEEEAKKN
ncbi:hypothetical protein POM88_052004 [Heracleum sosnowskyi]|uniref:Uncharacterized protein n=1 Tax=Heracleum sosnowskyi TaxID=360622 RepID=A0AAD8GSW4_9APIA|nr:hypothetical protein POM88_052004 [Heracleum sosnowskyi]